MKVIKRKAVLHMWSEFRVMLLWSKHAFMNTSPKWRVKNSRTRQNTSKQTKGGKQTLHNITGGILPLASLFSLEKAIHWDKSETFGDKMAGNGSGDI